jgi:CheY-like chemotaxis protein
MLSHYGHVVVSAASGKDALELFERRRFDLVITDFNMEGMKGDELAEIIKGIDPAQPIVMMTAHPNVPDASIEGIIQTSKSEDLRNVTICPSSDLMKKIVSIFPLHEDSIRIESSNQSGLFFDRQAVPGLRSSEIVANASSYICEYQHKETGVYLRDIGDCPHQHGCEGFYEFHGATEFCLVTNISGVQLVLKFEGQIDIVLPMLHPQSLECVQAVHAI